MAFRRATVSSQPPGLVGHAAVRPGADRFLERILDRLVGQIEVAELAGQEGDQSAAFPVGGFGDRRLGRGIEFAHAPGLNDSGRTSTEPLGIGSSSARASASSRSAAETR